VPRYDVPKAAPEPLRQVQLLINSIDLHGEVEWLPEWLAARGLTGEDARAAELREALRALVLANNRVPAPRSAIDVVNRAARRVALELDNGGTLAVRAAGDALDEVVAVVLRAMLDGSWTRLKACRICQWSFYDYSPNRSATWCSMQICGNRTKTRAYRRRRRVGNGSVKDAAPHG
jgi:predicted RNA-binding Zn ribbon-like protein